MEALSYPGELLNQRRSEDKKKDEEEEEVMELAISHRPQKQIKAKTSDLPSFYSFSDDNEETKFLNDNEMMKKKNQMGTLGILCAVTLAALVSSVGMYFAFKRHSIHTQTVLPPAASKTTTASPILFKDDKDVDEDEINEMNSPWLVNDPFAHTVGPKNGSSLFLEVYTEKLFQELQVEFDSLQIVDDILKEQPPFHAEYQAFLDHEIQRDDNMTKRLGLGNLDHNDLLHDRRRRLNPQWLVPAQMHEPLPCNNVPMPCSTPLSTLTVPSNGPLVIACGTCVYVDNTGGPTLNYPFGLRIEGKLYFPPSASLTIRTPYVLVFGELKMDTPEMGKKVTFSLYGETDVYFQPHPQQPNPNACPANGCKIGKKAIAVAGGKLDIQGMDNQCPSWEVLEDTSASTTIPAGSGFCSGNIVSNGNANDHPTNTAPWLGYGGSISIVSPGYEGANDAAFKGFDRSLWTQGIFHTLDTSCFNQVGDRWKLDLRVKMYNQADNAPLDCQPAENNVYCPLIRFQTLKDGVYGFDHMYDAQMTWTVGEWNHFSIIVDTPSHWIGLEFLHLIVAGGPDNSVIEVDNISMVPYLPGPTDQLVVSSEAAACWEPGSELLITTNTRFDADRQVVTVQSTDPGRNTITLSAPITDVSTKQSDPDLAVEVASLNRRIVFTADSSPGDNLIGGHLIIFQTRDVAQRIEGVELLNMGQQGNLGRYPIHFHLCESAAGSVVKKNVVRDSKQRCYVLHGTNNVMLEGNVAFDNFGHCFMLEDGSENGNTFKGNLAAGVKVPSRLLSALSGRTESDDRASAFWISNTQNSFEGNVAAGSASIGYFIEAQMSILGPSKYQDPDLNPHILPLNLFKDNTAHGCALFGWTAYPPGWLPETRQVIENLRVYRNAGIGMFIHNNQLLTFKGGYVGNNAQSQAWVFASDDIIFENFKIVGRSPYEPVSHLCQHGIAPVGVWLSVQKRFGLDVDGTTRGTTMTNVEFKHFSTTCGTTSSYPMQFQPEQVFVKIFHSPHKFSNVQIDDLTNTHVDACKVGTSDNVRDIVMEITNDAGVWGGSGFLVSPEMTAFAGGNACQDVGGCLKFCPGTCLRTVNFYTDSAFRFSRMVVSNTQQTLSVDRRLFHDGQFNPQTENPFTNAIHSVSLSKDQYTVFFLDSAGNVVYPDYVLPIFEAPPTSCSNYVEEADIVNIVAPNTPETLTRCNNLITNGNFHFNIDGWQGFNGGEMTWDASAGVGGSGALRTSIASPSAHVTQWIDSSCLNAGDKYAFTLSYRTVHNGYEINYSTCAPGGPCPLVYLTFESWDQPTLTDIPSSLAGSTVLPYKQGFEFNKITAVWDITPELAAADKVRISITNGVGKFILDDIFMIKI